MKHPRILLPFLLVLAMLSFTAAMQAAPKAPAKPASTEPITSLDSTKFVPESELKDGERGYALTVFQGTKIERFGVEILGVLHRINNGHDWILIKVTSGPSVTENLNIAEGMSGSPVYIGNRLVGAIAASIPFGRSPIGFVTPIGDMLEAWDPDLPSKPDISLSATRSGTSQNIQFDASLLAPYLGQDASATLPTSISIHPLQTPVMVSGMSENGVSRLGQILGRYGMTPMAGGGMAGAATLKSSSGDSLIPGAAVGCSLVQGDIDLTAIGTVTYRDKNRLIAFGHPFTDFGAIDAPLTTASIAGLIPSYQTSTKLGEPLATVGRVFQDRPFSIGGEIGIAPHMVPMTVNVIDHTNKRHKRFHFEIIDHPLLTGPLVLQVAQESILEIHGSPGDAIATVTTTVNAEQVGRVSRSNVFYDSLNIDQVSTDDLENLVRLLTSNNFYPLAIKGVDMEVTIDSSHATAQVDHIFVPKTKYQPGDTVNVGVVIKRYKQSSLLKTISLKIPSSTPDGAVTVVVRGGGVADSQTLSLGGTTIVLRSPTSQGPTPANVSQLVRQYLDQSKNNDLVATLQLPTTAVTVQGENLSLLPPTMSTVMRSARSTGVHTARDEVKQTEPTQYVLTGSQSISLTISHRSDLDTSTSPGDSVVIPDTNDTDVTPESAPSASASDDENSSSSSSTQSLLPVPDNAVLSPISETSSTGKVPTTPDPALDYKVASTTVTVGTTAGTPAPDAADAVDTKTKTVGRVAQIWRQDSSQDFSLGTLDNATVTSANDVSLSFSLKPLAQSTSSYIWCLAKDSSGTVFAGTGDDGIVYKLDSTGNMVPFFRTGELEVTSLAFDSQSGCLFAGTSPHGVVYQITTGGAGKRWGTVGDKYVTSLTVDPSRSRLYAATGGGTGDVYQFSTTSPGTPKQFFVSPETHLLSLALDSAGTVYAGGSPDGIIYAITPAGSGQVVYDSAQPHITALAVDSHDVLYAGSAPAGLIYRISTSASGNLGREIKILSARPKAAVTGLAIDPSGNVWASAGDSVYCVTPDDTTYTYAAPTDVTLLSLLVGADGQVFAGSGNTASIYKLGNGATNQTSSYKGTYTSPVHDARRPSRWGTIMWNGLTPSGTSITLETRSGDVPNPDQTWSDWSAPYSSPLGQNIQSPSSRFIQYKAIFASSNPKVRSDAMPSLASVAIYYLTRNQPPIVTVTSPSEGDFLSGSSILRWTALDPDHDTLAFDVYYSTDGKSYLPMPKSTTTTSPASVDQTNKLKEELDKHPEIPATVRQQMLLQVSASSASPASTSHVKTNAYTWVTTTVPDGQYQIKVVASDYQSNPSDPRAGEGYSRLFTVANTPPLLTLNALSTKINADKSISLAGTATSTLAFIKGVQYQLDKSKDEYSASASDGLFDSTNAPFTITTLPQTSGLHTIKIEAIDQAGNSSIVSTTVVVP